MCTPSTPITPSWGDTSVQSVLNSVAPLMTLFGETVDHPLATSFIQRSDVILKTNAQGYVLG